MEAPIKIDEKAVGKIIVDEATLQKLKAQDVLEILNRLAQLVATAIKNEELITEIRVMDEVRSDFVSSFPHELRTPITIIKDSLSMLSEGDLGEINEKQARSLSLITRNVDRLWSLSEELMEISQIALARAGVKRTLFDIVKVIEEVLSAAQGLAQARGVKITAKLPQAGLSIWGDREKLSIVLNGLVDNAIKFAKDNGSLEVSLKEVSQTVEISVGDNGRGIKAEDVKRLFDKFYRIERSIRTQEAHWGVGLVVANDIVQMHGGKISVESVPEQGSLFTVVLPKNLRSPS